MGTCCFPGKWPLTAHGNDIYWQVDISSQLDLLWGGALIIRRLYSNVLQQGCTCISNRDNISGLLWPPKPTINVCVIKYIETRSGLFLLCDLRIIRVIIPIAVHAWLTEHRLTHISVSFIQIMRLVFRERVSGIIADGYDQGISFILTIFGCRELFCAPVKSKRTFSLNVNDKKKSIALIMWAKERDLRNQTEIIYLWIWINTNQLCICRSVFLPCINSDLWGSQNIDHFNGQETEKKKLAIIHRLEL